MAVQKDGHSLIYIILSASYGSLCPYIWRVCILRRRRERPS